jgi:hypothetical protein
VRSLKSFRSTRSGRSRKSKRSSTSAGASHGWMLLPEGDAPEEEKLGMGALLGRAVMLERLLRAGKRVSRARGGR